MKNVAKDSVKMSSAVTVNRTEPKTDRIFLGQTVTALKMAISERGVHLFL